MPASCPDRTTLGRLLLGELSDCDLTVVANHLESCPECMATLKRLEVSDTLVGLLRGQRQLGAGSASFDSLAERLIARLMALNAETIQSRDTRPVAPAETLEPAPTYQRMGDYDLLERIGQGGMGIVYRAWHRRLDRVVALKMIRAGEFADESAVRRFHIEAESAAQLDHPGIVPVHEVGVQDGQHFMAMAYVAGQSLWERVKEAPLKPREAARVMQQVALAVQHAHDRGIVHRDIKPQNILLSADSKPRVTDFGLAKRQAGDSSLTATGQILGTPSYMPPEQAAGDGQPIGPAVDIYALGATLYCLLTGRPPFQAATPFETLRQVLSQDPVSPRTLNRAVDRDLETIALKCLEKEPRRRYASSAELAAELGRFLRNEPVRARPLSAGGRAWRWGRQHPSLAALSAIATAFLLTLAIGGPVVAYRELRAASKLSAEAQRANQREELARERAQQLQDQANRLVKAILRGDGLHPSHSLTPEEHQTGPGSIGLPRHLYDEARIALGLVPDDQRGWEHSWLSCCLEGTPVRKRAHQSALMGLAFCPTINRLATTSDDGRGRLWAIADGSPILDFPANGGDVTYPVCFTPDGNKLATIRNRQVQLTDATDAAELLSLGKVDSDCNALSFRGDGAVLAAGLSDGTVRLWDTQNGRELRRIQIFTPEAPSRTASPEQAAMAESKIRERADCDVKSNAVDSSPKWPTFQDIADRVVGGIFDFDFDLSGLELDFSAWNSYVVSVAFNPDGSRLATVCWGNGVSVWDVRSGQEVMRPKGQSKPDSYQCVLFNPNGTQLAAAGGDGFVVWDARTGEPVHAVIGSFGGRIAFSPDGTRLACGMLENSIVIWDTRTWVEMRTLSGNLPSLHGQCPIVLDFSSDGLLLASGSADGVVQLWDARNGDQVPQLRNVAGPVDGLAFTADGSQIAVGSGRRSVQWFDVGTLREVRNGKVDDSIGTAIARADQAIVSVFRKESGEFGLRDHSTGGVSTIPDLFLPSATALAISADGTRIACGESDGTVTVWDHASKSPELVLPGEGSAIAMLTLSSDGRTAAWALGDGSVGTLRHGHARVESDSSFRAAGLSAVTSIAITPDGTRLATGSDDGVVRLWNITDDNALSLTLHAHEAAVTAIAFSSNGDRMATGAEDQTVKLWNAQPTEVASLLFGHSGQVTSVTLNRDGRLLASGSEDGVINVWNLDDGEIQLSLRKHHSLIEKIAFNDDSTRLVSSARDKTVHTWQLPEGELLDAALPNDVRLLAEPPRDTVSNLRAFPAGNEVRLVRQLAQSEDRWADDEARRREWAATWHAEDADAAEAAGDWFAAAFHLQQLLALRPGDESLVNRYAENLDKYNAFMKVWTRADRADTDAPIAETVETGIIREDLASPAHAEF